MKQILTMMLLMVFSISLSAQKFTLNNSRGGFNVESGVKTTSTLTVENKSYDIYTTKKGSKYIIGISKSNKEYPVWIGESTNHTFSFENKEYPVRKFKSGKYVFFFLKNGKLSKKFLNGTK